MLPSNIYYKIINNSYLLWTNINNQLTKNQTNNLCLHSVFNMKAIAESYVRITQSIK